MINISDCYCKNSKPQLKLQSLEDRRFKNYIIFLFKLLNGSIDCPELVTKIPFNIPHHTLTFCPIKQNFIKWLFDDKF